MGIFKFREKFRLTLEQPGSYLPYDLLANFM
jgi:hypothetical protein